ncbi:MAG: IS701 family transposase [Solirubrobacteraceae bacterium]
MRRILFAVAAEREEVMMVVVTVAGSQVERDVDPPSVVRERLEAFAGEVLAEAMNRPVQLVNGGLYLRGLLEQGLRKSLEPLVSRLGGDADYQSMQQFLADSPWDPALVVRAVAERVAGEIEVEAWVLDDTGFPKDGKDSPGVKRQYSGTLGKIGNCQIGVSVHAVGKAGTVPLGWALYLPEEWCEDSERRRKAKIPDEVQFKTKFELGAELVERASGWAVTKAPVLGDHDYGRRVWLRERLDQAGCEYVLAVGPDAKAFEQGTSFQVPPRTTKSGPAPRRPQPDREPQPLGELIARLGQGSTQTVTFRDGPDGEPVTSTFILTRVHAAHGWHARREDQRGPRGREWQTDAELPPTRGMVDRRMAPRRGQSDRLLAIKPPRRHHARTARPPRPAALEDRART